MSRLAGPGGAGAGAGFKLWLTSPEGDCVFGEGKWKLLAAIRSLGSLQAAAASVGISYRKAWGDLRSAEKALGVTFLERRRGGVSGGETRLTEAGLVWLREFELMRDKVEKSVERALAEWDGRPLGEPEQPANRWGGGARA